MVMMIDYSKKIEEIRKYTMAAVSESRYEHSVRTAQMCKRICLHYNMDGEKGYLCGIAHDMCKKMNDDLLISFASKDGKVISQIEKDKPALLHGRAAAVKIKEDFGIDDPEIIEAIANHTFGGCGIGNYAKALYIADKIEPGREHVTEKYLNRLFSLSLDEMAYTVVNESVDYLTKKGKNISSTTMDFVKELAEKTGN